MTGNYLSEIEGVLRQGEVDTEDARDPVQLHEAVRRWGKAF